MAGDGESLVSWLNKGTNPSNLKEDWESIMGFCDQINKEREGPQMSVKLLSHKIQSPQEWEAVQALTVLETCMKNCGQRFHSEVGKYKFLNELVKVISPKYLGDKVSEKVKTKIIAMLYSWTLSLPNEGKICEAYEMLKAQGIVSVDPKIPLDSTLMSSPSPRPKNPVFDDEKKGKKLAELLKSKKPFDLQEANRIIKNMVKEDEVMTQKAAKQKSTMEQVNNSVKLLNEMLAHYGTEDSTDGDKELIKELYGDCDKLRQSVSQIATETEDNDSSLGDILQASDDLSHVIHSYKKIVEGHDMNGESGGGGQGQTSVRQGGLSTNRSEPLIDLGVLDNQDISQSQKEQPQSSSTSAASSALSLLDGELLSLGLHEAFSAPTQSAHLKLSDHTPSLQDSSQDLAFLVTTLPSAPTYPAYSPFPEALFLGPVATVSAQNFSGPVFSTPPVSTESGPTASALFSQPRTPAQTATMPAAPPLPFSMASLAFSAPPLSSPGGPPAPSSSLIHNLQDLTILDLKTPNSAAGLKESGRSLSWAHAPNAPSTPSSGPGVTSIPLPLGVMQGGSPPTPANGGADDSLLLLPSLSPIEPLRQTRTGREDEACLNNVFVPLNAIKPSQWCPVTAYDKNGIRLLLHFATECPAGRPDVLVLLASLLNTAPLAVRDIALQAAVPKMMKVRLQQPSGTELAPFNPVLPPPTITQVMLLANPLKENVRMRYKLTFTLGEKSHTEVGELNEFPPADRWGAL